MLRFQSACRTEGRTEIAFVASGTNLQLTFNCNMMPYGHERECDFEKEQGKVSKNQTIFATFFSNVFEYKKKFNLDSIQFVLLCSALMLIPFHEHLSMYPKNTDELRMISMCTSVE